MFKKDVLSILCTFAMRPLNSLYEVCVMKNMAM